MQKEHLSKDFEHSIMPTILFHFLTTDYTNNVSFKSISEFEVNYQLLIPKGQEGLKFRELRSYYTKLTLHPSDKEINDAAHLIYTGK